MMRAVFRTFALSLCLSASLALAARAQTFEDTLGLQPVYLTLDEAIYQVMEKSLDVRIEWLNWAVADEQIQSVAGKFDPSYFLTSTWRESNLPQNALEYVQTGGVLVPLTTPNLFRQQSLLTQTGISGKLPLGTEYKIFATAGEFRNDLNRSQPPAIFYPEYAASVGFSLNQPLLRDFGTGVNLAEVRVGRRNRAIADHQWEQQLQRSLAIVISDYYDLIFAVEDIDVKRGLVAYALTLVSETEKRLEAGLGAAAEVQEAEVAVAVAREGVITALSLAVEKQARLKLQMLGAPEERAVIFVPKDSLPMVAPPTDRARLLQTALQRRPDHRAALEEADKQAIIVQYTKNQLLPRLDLQATFTANGLSGNYGTAYERAFSRQGYDSQVGFQFSIPLGNRSAKAANAVAEHRRQQAILNIARSELTIGVELDTAIARVKAAKARYDSTRQSVALAERLLETERKRLAEGVARSFDVLKARQALADASTRRLAALADYNKAAAQLLLANGTLLDRHGIRVEREAGPPRAVR